MKTHFLFPSKLRWVGYILFVPSLIVAVTVLFLDLNIEDMLTTTVFAIADNGLFGDTGFFRFSKNSIGDEVLLSCLMIGGLLVGFSKQKHEDEYIAQIRYESLVWATYFNFAVLIFATLFIYGTYYFEVLVANVFTLLLFFVLRFHVMLHKFNKSTDDEE